MRTSKARWTGRSDTGLYRTVDGGAALGDLAARGRAVSCSRLGDAALGSRHSRVHTGQPGACRHDLSRPDRCLHPSDTPPSTSTTGTRAASSISLVDSTPAVDSNGFVQYTTGSVFDSNNNFYVTDDSQGDISKFSSSGAPMGVFASGLTNPESLVFDKAGNLYVGQQGTNYIAEFSPSGQRLADIGPLQTELLGDDWIDSRATSAPSITRPKAPTSTPTTSAPTRKGRPSTRSPSPASAPSSSRSWPTVTCSSRTPPLCLLLDQSGNVLQTYSCGSLPAARTFSLA